MFVHLFVAYTKVVSNQRQTFDRLLNVHLAERGVYLNGEAIPKDTLVSWFCCFHVVLGVELDVYLKYALHFVVDCYVVLFLCCGISRRWKEGRKEEEEQDD